MKQFDVTGMSCAACSARVEKAVSKVSGVTQCSVNLLTNSMSVEGSAKENDIIDAVVKAGYGASLKGQSITAEEKEEALKDTLTPAFKKRLLLSAVFLVLLMYVSMGHSMWGFPLPFLEGNYIVIGFLQLILSFIVLIINRRFFASG